MRLIDADKGKIVVEMTSEEREVISGIFSMISAIPKPGWEDSTGQADTAVTPEQFDKVYDSWADLLDGPTGKAYFVGKAGACQ